MDTAVREYPDLVQKYFMTKCVPAPVSYTHLDVYKRQHLTDREREVLALMAEGRSNRAIAERLFVTEHTVEKHIKNILGTLGLPMSSDDHRRVLAVITYLNSQ